jgi:hypothetical protein
MEEKLAALHGYRLPTYKRSRGQPRADDPSPTFFIKTAAQRTLALPTPEDFECAWTRREAELLFQRRGLQTGTAAGSLRHGPEWTPQQRQQFLELLAAKRQEETDGRTACDVDVHLAELFHGSQRGTLICCLFQ